MKKRGRSSHKDRLLDQSSQFLAFSRLYEQSAEQAKRKAEKDAILAKVSAGLGEVCKMLAESGANERRGKGSNLLAG